MKKLSMNASGKIKLSDRRKARHDRIQNNRISKLLLSEYREFSEKILIESPFAETTRNGCGVRQVTLGLTTNRLIVAADVFQADHCFFCPSSVDPGIETFELISVYPLDYVTLSVFRRRRRKTLKARFVDGKVHYYELGGGVGRKNVWGIWCEHVRRLLRYKMHGSSLSETTVASSSSNSTLYLPSAKNENNRNVRHKKPLFRIWTRYEGAGDYVASVWTEKDLYLGPSFNELANGRYAPVPIKFAGASLEDVRDELEDHTFRYVASKKSCHSWPCQTKSQRADGLCNVLFARDYYGHQRDYVTSCKNSPCSVYQWNDTVGNDFPGRHNRCYDIGNRAQQRRRKESGASTMSKVSRFGSGVPEKCNSNLILGPQRGDSDYIATRYTDPYEFIENGVTIWERDGKNRCESSKKQRHPRKYAFSSAPHFLHALGPWSVQPGERDAVQYLRSPSAVNIRRQPLDAELRLPVPRRQLTGSISYAALTSGGSNIVNTVTRGRIILFWTPEYWYRPQAASTAYRALRHHLASLRDFRCGKEKRTKRNIFRKRRCAASGENENEGGIVEKSSSLLERMLSVRGTRKCDRKTAEDVNTNKGTAQLKRLLRMNLRITAWDLDSTTLATQLTMIDRDLFIRIPATEIEILIFQKSSRNAPNLGAWIAFSHRITCLIVSEILAIKKLDMRTRIMARFINAADKCFVLGNFQSCRSILAGLQAPPIYRLRTSWSYLRTHHASRYESMEKLCKIYKSPQCSRYRKVWARAERDPPCIPYVGHFLIKALGLDDSRNDIQANFASACISEQSISQIKLAWKSLISNNISNLQLENGKSSIEPKQCLAKRILAGTLARMKLTVHQNIAKQPECDILWTCKQRYLGYKFFHRWRIILLESKIRAESERRAKYMDPQRKRILDVAMWLTNCQKFAHSYSFPLHSFACEFLLKARYREDRENFFISLKLESSKAT